MSTERESVFRRAGPTRFMFWLACNLPPVLGMVVVWVVTGLLILLRPPVYDAALRNLRRVLPPDTSGTQVRRILWRLLYNRTKDYYHFFHNFGRDVDVTRLRPQVLISADVQRYFFEAAFSGRGLLIVGTHTSNYDMCGCALGEYLPMPPMALSISDPAPGLQFINALRGRSRGEIKPVSTGSLRDAVRHLRAGGIVITGVDRPLTDALRATQNEPVTLFGATALLPTGYIRIPLITDCLVMTMACRYDDGAYHILGNAPMGMVRTGDRRRDEAVNLRRILTEVEAFVREAPDQWMVFVPVWPDGKDGVGGHAQT